MSSVLNNYNRKKISFLKGKGCYLYSTDGKKYLDFVQGIAVNSFGHCNDYLVKTQINLDGMESGIYFVKIGNGEKQQIKKLIKK